MGAAVSATPLRPNVSSSRCPSPVTRLSLLGSVARLATRWKAGWPRALGLPWGAAADFAPLPVMGQPGRLLDRPVRLGVVLG